VARGWVLERARARGLAVEESAPLRSALAPAPALPDPASPSAHGPVELFLSNAVRGIRRVAALDGAVLERSDGAFIGELQGEFDGLLEPP
jgi:hypothetical protein